MCGKVALLRFPVGTAADGVRVVEGDAKHVLRGKPQRCEHGLVVFRGIEACHDNELFNSLATCTNT